MSFFLPDPFNLICGNTGKTLELDYTASVIFGENTELAATAIAKLCLYEVTGDLTLTIVDTLACSTATGATKDSRANLSLQYIESFTSDKKLALGF